MKYNFDVIIIGAGVIGSAVARGVARLGGKALVVERESDVGEVTSSANSAIVHSGYDPVPGSLKAKMNVAGNRCFQEMCRELDVELEMIGSLTIATSDEEVAILHQLQKRAEENGVPVELLDRDATLRKEPNLTPEVMASLWAPTAGIVNTFELTVALMENAIDNGVELHLNEEVKRVIPLEGEGYRVETNRGEYIARAVINAAGLHADEISNQAIGTHYKIKPRRGVYFVLDHFDPDFIHHTIFTVPSSKGKGILVSPTTSGNYILGPSAEFIESKEDFSTTSEELDQVFAAAQRMVPSIPPRQIIRQFAGLRAVEEGGEFVIDQPAPGFINLLGIQSPGLTSCWPIAMEAVKMLKDSFHLEERKDFNPTRRPMIRLHRMPVEERVKFIKDRPEFGRIVCRCEDVSEGEILDAIHRNCGARTVRGVKKRVRPGFGKCQGGYCQPEVIKILARELHLRPEDVRMKSAGSAILLKPMGGEDDS